MMWFDLVVVADPRQRGADGRCLAALLQCAAMDGYRTGLIALRGPARAAAPRVAPALRPLLADGSVTWLDTDTPVDAGLALIYHVGPLLQGQARRLHVRARQRLLRLDQPPVAASGETLFDLAHLARQAEAYLGDAVDVVAADPLIAAALPAGRAGLQLDPTIWPPVTLFRAADHLADGSGPLGRHCLGGWGAVPASMAAILDAYPADGRHQVALAEGALALVRGLDRLPPSWRMHESELTDAASFLHGLHAYVFATAATWQPFAPAGLIEALAAAPLLVLPPGLAPFFAEAAIYLDGGVAVTDRLAALLPGAAQECRRAARALHRRVAGPEALAQRLRARLGAPAATAPRLALRREARAPRNVLFLSPNGVGMGHVTRLLAIARHGPGSIRPIFLSMSQAVGVVERFGFMAEYFPYHAHTGETAEAWSQSLRARLNEAIAFYDAKCVVFDGNVPYQGLTEARLDNRNRPFVWIRRGMWRADAGRATIDRGRHFDLVIEPGEFAAADDPGITAGRDGEAVRTAPITLYEPTELLDRAAARAELGLDPSSLAVIVQLGARSNFDYRQVDRIVLETLGRRADVQLVFMEWLIGDSGLELPAHVRRLRDFPVARLLPAFDLAVSACGYNSFHEILGTGLPAILVPNEHPMMDAQEVRALWADRRGHAVCVRAHETYRLAWALERLLAPGEGARVAAGAVSLPSCDGAREAAALIADLAGALPGADGGAGLARSLHREL